MDVSLFNEGINGNMLSHWCPYQNREVSLH
jgi:hypothetical protein